MRSKGLVPNFPSLPVMSHPPDVSRNASGLNARSPQEGPFSTHQRPNELFYENYGSSNYATTSNSAYRSMWHQPSTVTPLSCCSCSTNDPSTRLASSYVYRGTAHLPGPSKHVELTSNLPCLLPPSKSTPTRDLPPADPDTDYMERISPISAEDPLSPLSLYQDWQSGQLSLDPLHSSIYLSSMQLPRKWDQDRSHPIHPDDEETSPERRSYPPLLDIHQEFDKWMMSPDSVDTDLDDGESVLSSSTSSLSPPYSDSDLRHFVDSEEYSEDDYDDRYFSHNSPTPSSMTDLYHPLETYPSHHEHLYNPSQQHHLPSQQSREHQSPSSSQSNTLQMSDEQPPLEPPPPPISFTDHNSEAPPAFASTSVQKSPFSSPDCEFDDNFHSSIPCSPSRRRSTDLPPLDNDPFGLQNSSLSLVEHPNRVDPSPEPHQRTHWLSLPGAETDDDLIPKELASKNYVPDPTITVPSTHNGSLLIWDPTSSRFNPLEVHDLLPPRSPSPENINLDPATLVELAPEGSVEEAQRLYEMRQKTPKQESWERERCRELSALLRLKLRLDEKMGSASATDGGNGSGNVDNDGFVNGKSDCLSASQHSSTGVTRQSSFPLPTSTPASATLGTLLQQQQQQQQQQSTARRTSSKAKITSMAQLVANMVFHRQQEPLKRSPSRSRSAPLSSPDSSSRPCQKTHQTPRSPLRQVTLPQSVDAPQDGDDEVARMGSPMCLSPYDPMDLCESPLSLLTELEPIPMGQQEHD